MKRNALGSIVVVAVAMTPLAAAEPRATPAAHIVVPEGFRAELLRSAEPGEDSWISMTFDPEGRVIVGLDARGVGRLAPQADGSWSFERLDDTLRHCRGVLHAHGALYVGATDSRELWRFVDDDGDGTYEERRRLATFDYRSRYGHGTNQLVAGPDGMLFMMVGNDVSFPEGMSSASPYRDPRTDRLLPDPADAGQDDRVGYLLRFDPLGTEWTVVAGGFRNQVDVAFTPDGEAFTWDADMEWDVGLPWYRPTRINHVVSGGEYGWRWGTAKWPVHYADSLPSSLDTALGSPTGLAVAAASRFPPPWRDCLFGADWQHGRILAFTLEPCGASYTPHDRLFASGAPLNVCDMAFGPDGWLWVVTGGRGSRSGLYRIRWEGTATAATSDGATVGTEATRASAAAARARRRAIERYHGPPDAGPSAVAAVAAVWSDLGADDRWLRHAARVALERQPLAAWRDRVRAEPDPLRRATGLLAWARVGGDDDRRALEDAWLERSLDGGEETVLCLLRALAIALVRGAAPDDARGARIADVLRRIDTEPLSTVDRERCELLVALAAPDALELIIGRLAMASSQEDQIQLVHAAIRHPGRWSLPQREALLRWFLAARRWRGGHLFPKVMGRMEEDFLAQLDASERESLAAALAPLAMPRDASTASEQQPRPLVRHWTLEELIAALPGTGARDPAAGRRALVAGRCLECHRHGGTGTAIGPDLSAVGARFDARALAEAIVEPARVVDPKYQVTTWLLTDGRVLTGRAAQVDAEAITIEVDPLAGRGEKILRAEIESAHPAATSPMPAGLLDTLSLDEILDLFALLAPGGPAASPPVAVPR